ncbi:PP2C family protein-serine/threonine phosphatase [Candidatus Protofrankia californiensis]|uniref:PP2C family protein-serine/threonine phosphatase n=1 Tax=Candidatus Protofrankia californiensis TaxID=1839754 RepID=UPI00104111EC|nr:SpoIIE family protein phosphatase [Candidatus Protofrankia californiensis]
MKRQVAVLVVITLSIAFGCFGTALTAAIRVWDAAAVQHDRLGPAAAGAAVLLNRLADEDSGWRSYLTTGRSELVGPPPAVSRDISFEVDRLSASVAGLGTLPALMRQVSEAYETWRAQADSGVTAIRSGDAVVIRPIEAAVTRNSGFDIMRTRVAAMQQEIVRHQAQTSAQVDEAGWQLLACALCAVFLGFLIVAAVVVGVRRSVLAPVRGLLRAVRELAGGGYDRAVPRDGPAELAELGQELDAMRLRVLAALGQQGPTVAALRDALTASVAEIPGMRIASRIIPAEGVLAGDWYDTFELPNGRLGFTVGDAAGHGPVAGVHALLVKQLLASALLTGSAPDEAIQRVQRHLGDTGEMFATTFVAVVDLATGLVEYANAGHPEPVIVRSSDTGRDTERDTDTERDVDAGREGNGNETGQAGLVSLAPTGPLVAHILPDGNGTWRTERVRLAPGDVLCAYSDGLTEARDPAGNQFGFQRLAGELTRLPGRDPGVLVNDLFTAVAQHSGGGVADDQIAVAVVRTASDVIATPLQRLDEAVYPTENITAAPGQAARAAVTRRFSSPGRSG